MNAAVSPVSEALVRRLHERYLRVIDDGLLEEWPELFSPGGLYRITTRENHEHGLPLSVMLCEGRGMMKDRVTGFRRINVYEAQRYSHQQSGLQIEVGGDGALECLSNFLVIRTLQGGAMSLFAAGVYRDRVEVADGAARFLERTVITDSRQIDTLLVIPL